MVRRFGSIVSKFSTWKQIMDGLHKGNHDWMLLCRAGAWRSRRQAGGEAEQPGSDDTQTNFCLADERMLSRVYCRGFSRIGKKVISHIHWSHDGRYTPGWLQGTDLVKAQLHLGAFTGNSKARILKRSLPCTVSLPYMRSSLCLLSLRSSLREQAYSQSLLQHAFAKGRLSKVRQVVHTSGFESTLKYGQNIRF